METLLTDQPSLQCLVGNRALQSLRDEDEILPSYIPKRSLASRDEDESVNTGDIEGTLNMEDIERSDLLRLFRWLGQ